jgi:hypothetical protein
VQQIGEAKDLSAPLRIEWVPGALSSGVKPLGREDDNSLISSSKVKNGGDNFHSPIRIHGMMLN